MSEKQPPSPMRNNGRFSGPVEKPKNQKQTLYRIWQYLKLQKLGMTFAITFVILSTILSLLGPLLIGIILDEYILVKDLSGTVRMLILLGAVYTVSAALSWLQQYVMIRISQKTIRTLRSELFSKVQSLKVSFFDKRQQGDLMSRMTNDVENLNAALSQSVVQIVSSFLTIGGTAIAMVYLNWVLALVALTVIPLIVWATKQIIKRSSVNYKARSKHLGALNGYVEETISNSDITTLFGREESTVKQFEEANERLRHAALRADMISGTMGPINNFMNSTGEQSKPKAEIVSGPSAAKKR